MIYLLIFLSLIITSFGFYKYLKHKGYYIYLRLNKDLSIGNECLHLECTFPDGTNIYRIKTEYVMMIHSERMRVIDEYLNAIAFLGVDLETLRAGLSNMNRLCNEIVLKPYEQDSLKARDDHNKIGNNLLENTGSTIANNKESIRKMYLMFYVLDGEDFRVSDAKYDKRKLELLDQFPQYQSFFFNRLSKAIEPLGITYRNAVIIATETLLIKQRVSEIISELKESIPQTTT